MNTATTPVPVLVDGAWRPSSAQRFWDSISPMSGRASEESYPVSPWSEIDAAIDAGVLAYEEIAEVGPAGTARFLRAFATALEADRDVLVATAAEETALAPRPRLADVELPRTVDQLRQAADACEARTWVEATICTEHRISSLLRPLHGPVVVFGPNNFPFAFNGVTGGDAAAALATGHPVIAKANPGHPATSRRLAEAAVAAAESSGYPTGALQLLYAMDNDDGQRLVADPRLAAVAFTGSKAAGLSLKAAADAAGVPIFLEMASLNPVVVLPGALAARRAETVETLATSLLMGAGQFCTSPGLIFSSSEQDASDLGDALARQLTDAGPATLLGRGVVESLAAVTARWEAAGARRVAGGDADGLSRAADLFLVDGERFSRDLTTFTEEAFGNASLVVACRSADDVVRHLGRLPGSLTGAVFADLAEDERELHITRAALERFVGRILINKAPTGVTVCAAMNHGGPYPATANPAVTAVGIPSSLRRFARLQSFDEVPDNHLPDELRASNPLGLQRRVDGRWTDEPIGAV